MRCWGILFGVVVVVGGCAGKSASDDDDSGGSENDAGQSGAAATGAGQGGSGTAARGGGAGRGGTSSGGTPSSGGTGGGGTAGIGAAGEPANGGTGGSIAPVCTDLSAQVPVVQIVYSPTGTPPSPGGGTIQPGSYYFALETFYGAGTACEEGASIYATLGYQITEMVRFTAASLGTGSMELAAELSSASEGSVQRVTGAGAYSTSGTFLSFLPTCGEGVSGSATPIEFTAMGDQLVLFSTEPTECDLTVAVFQRF